MITDDPIHPVFITGVIDGDGSFYISFLKTGKIKPGFHITSDNISIPLLEKIKYFFGNIGSILLKTPSIFHCYSFYGFSNFVYREINTLWYI
jgi:hypothetical protein